MEAICKCGQNSWTITYSTEGFSWISIVCKSCGTTYEFETPQELEKQLDD